MNRPGTNIPYSDAAIQSLRDGFTKGLPCGVLSFADRAEERRFQKEVNRQAHEAASRMHAAIPTAHKDGRTDGPGRVERQREEAIRRRNARIERRRQKRLRNREGNTGSM